MPSRVAARRWVAVALVSAGAWAATLPTDSSTADPARTSQQHAGEGPASAQQPPKDSATVDFARTSQQNAGEGPASAQTLPKDSATVDLAKSQQNAGEGLASVPTLPRDSATVDLARTSQHNAGEGPASAQQPPKDSATVDLARTSQHNAGEGPASFQTLPKDSATVGLAETSQQNAGDGPASAQQPTRFNRLFPTLHTSLMADTAAVPAVATGGDIPVEPVRQTTEQKLLHVETGENMFKGILAHRAELEQVANSARETMSAAFVSAVEAFDSSTGSEHAKSTHSFIQSSSGDSMAHYPTFVYVMPFLFRTEKKTLANGAVVHFYANYHNGLAVTVGPRQMVVLQKTADDELPQYSPLFSQFDDATNSHDSVLSSCKTLLPSSTVVSVPTTFRYSNMYVWIHTFDDEPADAVWSGSWCKGTVQAFELATNGDLNKLSISLDHMQVFVLSVKDSSDTWPHSLNLVFNLPNESDAALQELPQFNFDFNSPKRIVFEVFTMRGNHKLYIIQSPPPNDDKKSPKEVAFRFTVPGAQIPMKGSASGTLSCGGRSPISCSFEDEGGQFSFEVAQPQL